MAVHPPPRPSDNRVGADQPTQRPARVRRTVGSEFGAGIDAIQEGAAGLRLAAPTGGSGANKGQGRSRARSLGGSDDGGQWESAASIYGSQPSSPTSVIRPAPQYSRQEDSAAAGPPAQATSSMLEELATGAGMSMAEPPKSRTFGQRIAGLKGGKADLGSFNVARVFRSATDRLTSLPDPGMVAPNANGRAPLSPRSMQAAGGTQSGREIGGGYGHVQNPLTRGPQDAAQGAGDAKQEVEMGDLPSAEEDRTALNAIAYYRKELEKKPENKTLHNVLGVALAKQGDVKGAMRHYAESLQYDPDYFAAHYNLGRASYRLGDIDASLRHYKRALKLAPQDKKVHNSLGIVYAEQGLIDDAAFHFHQAVKIMEDMLETSKRTLLFKSMDMEQEFQQKRMEESMVTMRLLLAISIAAVVTELLRAVLASESSLQYDGSQSNDLNKNGDTTSGLGSLAGTIPGGVQALVYGAEFTLGCMTSLLTFHPKFAVYKVYTITFYLSCYFVGQMVTAWMILLENGHDYIVKDGNVLHMGSELHDAFNTLTRDCTVALALPQLCGLRWSSMLGISSASLAAMAALMSVSPDLALFIEPGSITAVFVLAVALAYSVEKSERNSFRTAQLYITEKECRAQSEEDWRRASDERHQSDIVAAKAQTELRTRSQFVAWIFHEIRNPLNAMFGAIQMFGATATTSKQDDWTNMAMTSADMVSNVLNDVLCLSKIEEGGLQINPVSFDISACVEEVRFMFREQAKKNNIRLECCVDPNMELIVIADVTRIKEVLANFCSNAIKFTAQAESGRDGCVTITVKQTARSQKTVSLDIHVSDNGRGIAASDFDKLFLAYSQIFPTSGTKPAQGAGRSSTGLGLSISKHIVEAHGGKVYVTSDGIGRGATFGFRLTFLIGALPAKPTAEDTRKESEELGPPGPLSARQVLIVEDDDFNLEVVTDMISSAGWVCHTASDGKEALCMITDGDHSFACVVTDCIMPVMDGWTLTTEITRRRLPLPVIGLTGSVSDADLSRCREVGMVKVLTKPVKMMDLLQTIHSTVKQSLRVLLVDDDDFNREIVSDMLTSQGWICKTAVNGEEALRMLQLGDGLEIDQRFVPYKVARFGPQLANLTNYAVVRADPSLANAPLQNADEIKGKFVLIKKCRLKETHPDKSWIVEQVLRCQDAGAIGAFIGAPNNVVFHPTIKPDHEEMGRRITIPVVGIKLSDATEIESCVSVASLSIGAGHQQFEGEEEEYGAAGEGGSAKEGVHHLSGAHGQAAGFACVLTDCVMPVMTGWELAEVLTRHRKWSKLDDKVSHAFVPPIIGLTGGATEEERKYCLEAGMCSVLTKPVRIGDLTRVLTNAINGRTIEGAEQAAANGEQPERIVDQELVPRLGQLFGSFSAEGGASSPYPSPARLTPINEAGSFEQASRLNASINDDL